MKELNSIKIGAKIRERRLQMERTQDYLADYLDIDSSHISNIERGRCKVSLTALVGISNALDCSVDYFLFEEYRDQSIPLNNQIINQITSCDIETKRRISRIIDVL